MEFKDWQDKFYSSKKWKKFRKSCLADKGGVCVKCGIIPTGKWRYSKNNHPYFDSMLIAHHITHITPHNCHDASITLNKDNIEFICVSCHNELHKKKEKELRYSGFDHEGNVIMKDV